MGILVPLVVPLSIQMAGADAVLGPCVLGTLGAVLAGAIVGDHASPISDTTVLSAVGSGVDVMTHTRTQLPYAITTAVVSLVLGYLPGGYGVTPWLLVPLGVAACAAVLWTLGRRPADYAPTPRSPRNLIVPYE
jgi:Na+/H+ antiporter NhaC